MLGQLLMKTLCEIKINQSMTIYT